MSCTVSLILAVIICNPMLSYAVLCLPCTLLPSDNDSQDEEGEESESEDDEEEEGTEEEEAKLWPSLNVRTRWLHATKEAVTVGEVSLALQSLIGCARSYGVVGEDPLAGECWTILHHTLLHYTVVLVCSALFCSVLFCHWLSRTWGDDGEEFFLPFLSAVFLVFL